MVEAFFQLDAFRRFGCGTGASTHDHRFVVVVDVFKTTETCSSDVFLLYRGEERLNIMKLVISPHDSQTWKFDAFYIEPPPPPDDPAIDGGFDYYCAAISGRLARSDAGWRAWVE
jgi:hypothetical protein